MDGVGDLKRFMPPIYVRSLIRYHFQKFTKQRQQFRRRLKEEEIKVDINSAIKLLDTPAVFPYLAQYVEETGRFTHLKTYIDKDST